MAILTIARLTFRELTRRRVLFIAAALTLLMVVFTAWGFERMLNIPCRGARCSEVQLRFATAFLLILVMYMYSFIVALGAAFLAAPAIAAEIDSGVALAMFPRPIRRSDVVIGKWLALAGLVVGYTVLLTTLQFGVVWMIADYLPPQPVFATLYIAGQGVVLLTLALYASTRLSPIAGGIAALVLFGLAWMAGVAQTVGLAYENPTLINVGVVSSLLLPTDGLWRGAMFYLEPAAVRALSATAGPAMAANPFFVAAPPTPAYHVWALAWVVGMVGLSCASLQRRDI